MQQFSLWHFGTWLCKTVTAQPQVDGDHGRIETRTATVSTDIKWLQDAHRWPGRVSTSIVPPA